MNTRGSTSTSFVTHLQTGHYVSVNTHLSERKNLSSSVAKGNGSFYPTAEFALIIAIIILFWTIFKNKSVFSISV